MSEELKETLPYSCYKRYKDNFFTKANIMEVLKESRDFYFGRHYTKASYEGMPKPVFNICNEYVEKVSAKILEVKPFVSFIADTDSQSLRELDNFYDYQLKEIDDEEIRTEVCRTGFIDGIAVVITSFDKDTLGSGSVFRGCLKREIIPFERTYWENPYTQDEQDQQYWGYYFVMSIKAVKNLLEPRKNEKETQKLKDLIVPEDLDFENYDKNQDIDNQVVNVYVRFFRIDGEVFFELATKYVDIYEHPHALNPKVNEKFIAEKKKEYEKEKNKHIENENEDKKIFDMDMDTAKYTLFTKAEKTNPNEKIKEKGKFYRYPVSIFKPYPIQDCILGRSGLTSIIPNQKIINYTFLNTILIMQNHAMPKILVKEGALNGQNYDNSPNQILTDYSQKVSGVDWGIKRLSSGDAINSNLVEIGNQFIKTTRNINGFDDLTSNISSDTSGFAYQQIVQQANLTLQQPQKRLWKYIKDNARTDMLYLKHYVEKAKYSIRLSESEVELNETYRNMAQGVANKIADKKGIPCEELPPTRQVQVKDMDCEMFDNDFNVCIDVEQGIAGSQLTESQHYNQIWQYISAGNIDADKIKLLVENDPAFSQKLKAKVKASLEQLENSQIAIKNQEIEQLKGLIQQLSQSMKNYETNLTLLKKQDAAREKAFRDSLAQNKAFVQMAENRANEKYDQAQQTISESQVKSNNAKGKGGTHFAN